MGSDKLLRKYAETYYLRYLVSNITGQHDAWQSQIGLTASTAWENWTGCARCWMIGVRLAADWRQAGLMRWTGFEAFMDTLCIERAVVGGNCQGAWVAAKYALQHPDRVDKLLLIASNAISGAMGLESPVTEGMRAIRAYNGTEESMRAFLKTIVWNKNLITDELVKLRNDCANRPGAEAARKTFQKASSD
jgi:pimeloyl-ACP methyl ester carboxylesterase